VRRDRSQMPSEARLTFSGRNFGQVRAGAGQPWAWIGTNQTGRRRATGWSGSGRDPYFALFTDVRRQRVHTSAFVTLPFWTMAKG
jgi:hypothetical protein